MSVIEAIRGVHFAPADRIQAIRWADAAASIGIHAEFFDGHEAMPETFEVYGSANEDDPNPITAAAEVEWIVWRDFAGFNVDNLRTNAQHRFPAMSAALDCIATAMAA